MKIDDLKAALAKVESALPLTWEHRTSVAPASLWWPDGDNVARVDGSCAENIGGDDVAAYLCLAANALPKLLAAVERVKAMSDPANGWHVGVRSHCADILRDLEASK